MNSSMTAVRTSSLVTAFFLFSMTAVYLACLPHDFPGTRVPELTEVCLTYVDSEGFLRGRTAMFTTHEVPSFSGILKHSYEGSCLGQEEGPAERTSVCLVASSPCHNNRTRSIWEDEVTTWFKRFPDSHRGECEEEGRDVCTSEHFDFTPTGLGCASWDKKCVDGKLRR